MDNKDTLKISLRSARVNAGLLGSEVAEQLCVTPATLYNWENHKTVPDIKQTLKLCEIYKIDISQIKFD